MSADVKHGGCAKCGGKDEPVLVAILLGEKTLGQALCSKCRAKLGVGP